MRTVLAPAPVALFFAASVAAQGPLDASSTELEPITVQPQYEDPFDASMQRIRKAFEDPECRGCPPAIRAYHPSAYEQIGAVVSFLTGLGAEPPQVTPAERIEYRVRNEWRYSEWGPERRNN